MEKIKIKTKDIKLSQFLKWANITETGGEAKLLIQEGNVKVNGEVKYKRGLKLTPGDIVEIKETGTMYKVSKK